MPGARLSACLLPGKYGWALLVSMHSQPTHRRLSCAGLFSMLHLQVPPQPGQILVGYETCQPVGGCCVCDGLSAGGVIAIVILVLVFWPLAWIPCVMPGANLGCCSLNQPPSSLAQVADAAAAAAHALSHHACLELSVTAHRFAMCVGMPSYSQVAVPAICPASCRMLRPVPAPCLRLPSPPIPTPNPAPAAVPAAAGVSWLPSSRLLGNIYITGRGMCSWRQAS